MISSPSAQIVNAIAESHLVKAVDGELAPAYGPTMGIATAIIAIGKITHFLILRYRKLRQMIGIAVTTALGPERRGAKFELAKVAGVREEERRKSVDVESQTGEKASAGQAEFVAEKQ